MSTIIRYNGVNPFLDRTPFVSTEVVFQDNNGYSSRIDRYTISGTRPRTQIAPVYDPDTGLTTRFPCAPFTFSDVNRDIQDLINIFHLNFRLFEVVENGNVIFSCPQAIIRSISFPENTFRSFYPFEIVIDCIRSYQDLGIVEPVDIYETSQDDSYVTTIKHTVSCRGVGPAQVAIENATQFVENARTNLLYESFAGSVNELFYPATRSRNYSINRLTGEVSLTTTYIYDEEHNNPTFGYPVLTWTCSIEQSDGQTIVTINGNSLGNSVDGDDEMEQARFRFDNVDWQAIAQSEWEKSGGATILAENTGFTVDENPLTSEVSFSLTWNSDSENGAYIQDSSTVMRSYDGNPTCFRYRGTVKMDRGCAGARFQEVKNLFEATNFTVRALQKWDKYGTGEKLSVVPRQKTVTTNEFAGTISFEVEYCHSPFDDCGCAENMIYSFDFTASIQQYSPQPVLRGRGRYIVQNLGFKNRRKFSIQGQARRAKCCNLEQAKANLKTRINLISAQYFTVPDKILEEARIENDLIGDLLSFTYSWSGAAD